MDDEVRAVAALVSEEDTKPTVGVFPTEAAVDSANLAGTSTATETTANTGSVSVKLKNAEVSPAPAAASVQTTNSLSSAFAGIGNTGIGVLGGFGVGIGTTGTGGAAVPASGTESLLSRQQAENEKIIKWLWRYRWVGVSSFSLEYNPPHQEFVAMMCIKIFVHFRSTDLCHMI